MPGHRVHVSTADRPREGIICPHCKLILRDAIQTSKEGHRLCESCYKEICSLPSRTCEDCGISLSPEEHFYPDRAVRRDVQQVSVWCSYHDNGCPWEGQLQNMEEHSEQCHYKPVSCPNEGCEQLLVPQELDRHIDEECLYRRVSCQYCGQQETANTLTDHYNVCPNYPVECSQCQKTVRREGIEEHQRISCPYIACAVKDCGQLLQRSPTPSHSSSKAASDHYEDKNRLFHHIQSLALAIRDLEQRPPGTHSGASATPSGAAEDRTWKNIENRLMALQKKFEANQLLQERMISELQENLYQKDKQIQRLEQTLKSIAREGEALRQQLQLPAHGSIKPTELRVQDSSGIVYDSTILTGTGQTTREPHFTAERTAAVEKKIEEIERQNALLKVHVSELELQLQASLASTYTGSFLWRIPDVRRRKRDAVEERVTSIYSPPFYSGRNGYKMCLRAYLNGDGAGYNTHLSLFFVLMKGEYDPLLKWPFDSKVSLVLVDQNHRKHIVQTFKPAGESSSFQRPRSEMNIASGCPQFHKLAVLDDENFVRDDVMFVKCTIDTSKIFHP